MEFMILLPPSQAKNEGGTEAATTLSHTTKEFINELSKHKPEEVYSSRIQEAKQLNSQIPQAKTMPAIQRYNGVVYKALDYETLTNKEYVDKHVYIVSSMFGLLQATTPIPNYKSTMNTLGVYKKWREILHIEKPFVIDLLASTQRKAVSYDSGVQIEFTQEKNGRIVRAGHAGKTIKGKFVRWLAENNITSVTEMYAFSEDGYSWSGEAFHKPE